MKKEYTTKIINSEKFWLESGWYTIAELKQILAASIEVNKHLQKSMEMK
jgi:hypothetical protein